jgi:hypothetical protein
MNKKYLYLSIGVIFVILIIIVILLPQSSSQTQILTPSNSPSPSSEQSSTGGSLNNSQVTNTPEHLTPEDVARKFYSWYLTYPGVSALSSGAYNTNSYLTDKFKGVITAFAPYSAQDDPVFCVPNKLANFTVLPAVTTANGRQSVIIRSVPDGKDLYKVVLKNINGNWLVDDTICIP